MSGFLESFFDENVSETFNLWSKDIEGSMDFSKEKVVHKGELYKYSRARKKWSQRYFVVTEKHLLYYKVGWSLIRVQLKTESGGSSISTWCAMSTTRTATSWLQSTSTASGS